jgi:hypothetical protein
MPPEEIQRIENHLDDLFRIVRDSVRAQAETAVAVARIEERLAAITRNMCPAPGL